MTHLATAPCKLCGKPIVWAKGLLVSGAPANLPMDPRAPCYVVTQNFGADISAERKTDVMVLHHATCQGLRKKPADDLEVETLRESLRKANDRIAYLKLRLDER